MTTSYDSIRPKYCIRYGPEGNPEWVKYFEVKQYLSYPSEGIPMWHYDWEVMNYTCGPGSSYGDQVIVYDKQYRPRPPNGIYATDLHSLIQILKGNQIK